MRDQAVKLQQLVPDVDGPYLVKLEEAAFVVTHAEDNRETNVLQVGVPIGHGVVVNLQRGPRNRDPRGSHGR